MSNFFGKFLPEGDIYTGPSMPSKHLSALFCALLCPLWAHAQDAPAPQAPTCSVITVAPGDSLDALFGHTAIRIKDPRLSDGDIWFDYGVFNPSDWTFFIHYAKGDAKYLLVAADPQSRLDFYKEEGREVVEQRLNLTPQEAQKLEDYLIENLRHPEYEYRFLDDNCTTRAKVAIEVATGRKIVPVHSDRSTFRQHTDLKLAKNLLAMLGANLLMGRHSDTQSAIFLPDMLGKSIDEGKYDGKPLDGFDEFCTAVDAFKTILISTLIFSLFFFACAIPTLIRWRKHVPLPSRGYLDALLFASVGAIGCLMTFLGFWSLHPELGAFNWNLIWCWPMHLVFAAFLVFRAHGKLTRAYARVAAIGASCAALAYFFVPQALPVPLFPLVLLLALRAWRWGWGNPNIDLPPVAPPSQPR